MAKIFLMMKDVFTPMEFSDNTVLMTGGGFNFVGGNASTNLSVQLAKAYRTFGLSPLIIPQNPSSASDEPRAGSFETIPYAYPMRHKNVLRGSGRWRDRLNYRLCFAFNPFFTAMIIRRNRRRISHVFSETLPPMSLTILAIACLCFRVPLVYHIVEEPWTLSVHADTVKWRRLARIVRQAVPILLFYTVTLRLTTAIACITQDMIALLHRWGYDDTRLIYLPNVRFLGDGDSNETRLTQQPEQNAVSDVPFILYAGEISDTKEAFAPLIEAIGHMNAQCPRLALRIYGGGSQEAINRVKKLVESNGIAEKTVRFCGFVGRSELRAATENSLLCLLLKRDVPFNRYNFPTKLMDYLAAGKPVLMSDLPLHHYYFRDRVDALMVNPECADEIHRALTWALGNQRDLVAIGDRARQKLSEHFCAVDNVQRLLARIERHVVPGHTSGGCAYGT